GRFVLPDLPVGLLEITARSVGHVTLSVPEVLVRAGKETVLAIALEPATHRLSALSIMAMGREEPDALGVITFTVDLSQRYLAMVHDPSRLGTVTFVAGAHIVQFNHLIVSGLSTFDNVWLPQDA